VKVIGIVPARGGSKRFPRKNVALLGGRPLLAWTLRPALRCPGLDALVLTTDDDEIAAMGRTLGVRVLRRSARLGADDVTVPEVVLATLDALAADGERYDAAYALIPTSPFRSTETMERALAAFHDAGAGALVSVMPQEFPPEWTVELRDGFVYARDPDRYALPRPALVPAYRPDGGHLIATYAHLRRYGDFMGPGTLAFVAPASERVDIDTPHDLAYAAFLVAQSPALRP
jgi:CMP-N-acetylneuraminic acid synthetase